MKLHGACDSFSVLMAFKPNCKIVTSRAPNPQNGWGGLFEACLA